MKTRFVLIETSHGGNVGAAARALKVMGFDDLVLVRPRWPDVLEHALTTQRASGADDVLQRASVVHTLEQALEGITHACATVMTPRDFGPPTRSPREHFNRLLGLPGAGSGTTAAAVPPAGVAFLFGCERYGMSNEDVYHCQVALRIPSNPDYGSLNLAAAVQLIAYDWRMALMADGHGWATRPVARGTAPHEPVDMAELEGMLAHWQRALTDIGFLDPAVPRKLMPRLQQLFARARPDRDEINILRGIARTMQKCASSGAGGQGAIAGATSGSASADRSKQT